MASYQARPATAADLPMILRAEREYITAVEPDQLASWTAAIDRNLALWIANLERTTVLESGGSMDTSATAPFVMWTPDPSGAAATLVTIHVPSTHRRRGLGRKLLDVFADQARESGAQTLLLGVHEHNPARSLYPDAGYSLTGRDGDYLLYRRPL